MKSARRHELQTNELADLLGRWGAQIRPYLSWILIAVIAVFGGWALFRWYTTSQTQASGEGWRSFFLAMAGQDKEQIQKGLESVATDYNESSAAHWALVVAGDVDLSDGLQQLFQDKALAETSLRSAIEKYEQVLKALGDSTEEPLLRVRALFGLAQAHEALGEVDEAIDYYKQVAELGTSSVLAEQAKERLAMLEDRDMKKWYFWFRRQEPKPPSAERPAPGLPGSLPGLDSLSDFPDLGNTPGTDTAPPSDDKKSPADESPAGAEKKSDGEEPPAADKKSDESTGGAGAAEPTKGGGSEPANPPKKSDSKKSDDSADGAASDQ